MLDAAFIIGTVCACVGAGYGDRTAWALLLSSAVCITLSVVGVPFVFPAWLLIDLAVVGVILVPGFRLRDLPILALFIPLFASYLFDGEVAYAASVLIVAAQMMLTFPLERLWRRPEAHRPQDTERDYDMMVKHGV